MERFFSKLPSRHEPETNANGWCGIMVSGSKDGLQMQSNMNFPCLLFLVGL